MKFKLGMGDVKVKRYISIQEKKVPECMRLFMIEFYRQVTYINPVLTGRARWGWNCSIKKPDLTIPPEGNYGWDTGRADRVFTVEVVTGKDPIYLANAVPYIRVLNKGWSKKAPARFVQLSFETAYRKLQKYIWAKGYYEPGDKYM